MKRIILSLMLALTVSACGTYKNPLSPSRMDLVDASWGAALSLANGYYDSCQRRLIAPTCRTVVATMQRAAGPIHAKIKKARAFARNPTLSNIDLIEVASDAVNDFKLLQSDLGVK